MIFFQVPNKCCNLLQQASGRIRAALELRRASWASAGAAVPFQLLILNGPSDAVAIHPPSHPWLPTPLNNLCSWLWRPSSWSCRPSSHRAAGASSKLPSKLPSNLLHIGWAPPSSVLPSSTSVPITHSPVVPLLQDTSPDSTVTTSFPPVSPQASFSTTRPRQNFKHAILQQPPIHRVIRSKLNPATFFQRRSHGANLALHCLRFCSAIPFKPELSTGLVSTYTRLEHLRALTVITLSITVFIALSSSLFNTTSPCSHLLPAWTNAHTLFAPELCRVLLWYDRRHAAAPCWALPRETWAATRRNFLSHSFDIRYLSISPIGAVASNFYVDHVRLDPVADVNLLSSVWLKLPVSPGPKVAVLPAATMADTAASGLHAAHQEAHLALLVAGLESNQFFSPKRGISVPFAAIN